MHAGSIGTRDLRKSGCEGRERLTRVDLAPHGHAHASATWTRAIWRAITSGCLSNRRKPRARKSSSIQSAS